MLGDDNALGLQNEYLVGSIANHIMAFAQPDQLLVTIPRWIILGRLISKAEFQMTRGLTEAPMLGGPFLFLADISLYIEGNWVEADGVIKIPLDRIQNAVSVEEALQFEDRNC